MNKFICLIVLYKVRMPRYHHVVNKGERSYISYSFLTSTLGGGDWSASRSGRALPTRKVPPVHIGKKAWCASELVWTQRLEDKCFAGNRTPVARSSSLWFYFRVRDHSGGGAGSTGFAGSVMFFSVRHSIHGREIFKIEGKEMRDICIVKFGNTVKAGNCLNIVLC
jgi:hypothetical protein